MTLRLILALAAICWMFLVANAWAGEDCSGPILQWSDKCIAHMNDTPKYTLYVVHNDHGRDYGLYPDINSCRQAGELAASRGEIEAYVCRD